MLYLEQTILYCLYKLNGERSIYSAYHLLKGKKSSQTIQDAHLFGLTHLFRAIEFLNRDVLDMTVQSVYEKGWISQIAKQHFKLSDEGRQELKLEMEKRPLPIFLNGWKNQHQSSIFWERLSLLVQVVSNLTFRRQVYVPVQKSTVIHAWLKEFFKVSPYGRDKLAEKLFEELVICFEANKTINPDYLVPRLTGYNSIGLTSTQMAEQFGMEPIEYHFEFLNVLHFLIFSVEKTPSKFELLSRLLEVTTNNLTISTQKSYKLLMAGYTVENIAKTRNLKISTVEDHIVEMALNIEDFSILPFVDRELQQRILRVAQSSPTRQLKNIREKLPQSTYFEIRLVLAKKGEKQ